MKNKLAIFSSILSILVIFSFVVAPVVSARIVFPSDGSKVLSETDESTPSSSPVEKAQEKAKEAKEKARERLSEAKKKVCEKLESAIKRRSTNMATRAERMTNRFSLIAEKVKDFYTEKAVPAGITVDNYDELVDDIAEKEAAVNDAVAEAKSTISSFDCDAQGPKEKLEDFKDAMHKVIDALREYRKSIVNLVVAIRTAYNEAEGKEATGSAEPATGSASP